MIYMIEAVGTPFVKIGYTREDVESRLKSLETGSPHDLRVVWTFQGNRDDEAWLHRALGSVHERREWFRRAPFMETPEQLFSWVEDYYNGKAVEHVGRKRRNSLRALAEIHGVSHTTIRRWRDAGKLSPCST
jgi:hypothetical protein